MPKETTSVKKRKTTRTRAKKPKVKLAKNKVALFCGLICGICVLAIGLSVVLNQGEKQDSQKAEVVAKAEPVPKTEKKSREIYAKRADSADKAAGKAKINKKGIGSEARIFYKKRNSSKSRNSDEKGIGAKKRRETGSSEKHGRGQVKSAKRRKTTAKASFEKAGTV
ncbi:MAG: hypothetical protein IJR39_04210 [Treponema sp.]|nr:hypothetical protein [Treponema sp.]